MIPIGSCRRREDFRQLGHVLSVLKAVRQDAQRQCLDLGHGDLLGLPIRKDTRQIGDLGKPPAILFALDSKVKPRRWWWL